MSRLKILILKPDNIGDAVLFSGALQHVRNLHPEAHVTLALNGRVVDLFVLCPFVDACVSVDTLAWWGKLERRNFFLENTLRRVVFGLNKAWSTWRGRFDTIIFPVKSPQYHQLELVDCLNVKNGYGVVGCTLNAPPDGWPARLHPERLFTECFDSSKAEPWVHELHFVSGFLHFLGCRDLSTDDILPRLWLSGQDNCQLDSIRGQGKKIVALFPGASAEMRQWPPANYGALAGLLEGPLLYVIFGSTADRDVADQVSVAIRESRADVEVVNLAGKTSLSALAKCISCCDLFIGMETSGLHVAIAAGVPTVGIVGGGHFGRFAPWGSPEKHMVVTHKLDCFHCNWVCSREEPECITDVTPFAVAQAARELLE